MPQQTARELSCFHQCLIAGWVRRENTTKRLPRQGVSHAWNGRACSAINHRTHCLQLKAADSSSPHKPALQAMPVPAATRPACRSYSPAGLEQTHKSITKSKPTATEVGLTVGRAIIARAWFSSKMELSQESCRKYNRIRDFSLLLHFLCIFPHILDDASKKMLCTKLQAKNPLPHSNGVDTKPEKHEGQLLSASFKNILSSKCSCWCQKTPMQDGPSPPF